MKFIADENIPYQVVEVLRQAGYEVSTVVETTYLGMRNDELATLSIQLQRAVLTRDADFTHLGQALMRKIKAIYIRLSGDPNIMAMRVLDNIQRCIEILQDHNIVVLDETSCLAL